MHKNVVLFKYYQPEMNYDKYRVIVKIECFRIEI
jgi:hypothetical protein